MVSIFDYVLGGPAYLIGLIEPKTTTTTQQTGSLITAQNQASSGGFSLFKLDGSAILTIAALGIGAFYLLKK